MADGDGGFRMQGTDAPDVSAKYKLLIAQAKAFENMGNDAAAEQTREEAKELLEQERKRKGHQDKTPEPQPKRKKEGNAAAARAAKRLRDELVSIPDGYGGRMNVFAIDLDALPPDIEDLRAHGQPIKTPSV